MLETLKTAEMSHAASGTPPPTTIKSCIGHHTPLFYLLIQSNLPIIFEAQTKIERIDCTIGLLSVWIFSRTLHISSQFRLSICESF